MAYRLPVFNIKCNIWRRTHVPPGPSPDIADVDCNLAAGRRHVLWTILPTPIAPSVWQQWINLYLLLPKDTDIRGTNSISGNDWAEVPAGSGIYYGVRYVYNAATGFSNQHRVAIVNQTTPYIDPLPH